MHIHHRKKIPSGCIERLARSGSCRESVRGVVGTMNAARSRPDWLATVQSGRKQAQSRVCTPGFRHVTRALFRGLLLTGFFLGLSLRIDVMCDG